MEKREQRVRRDRRRDGKRNTFHNEQGKETVKQQDSSVEEKKNDAQNVEVSNKKNSSEEKDKTIEDDPLRFANLKRETDEIAALKAKKPHKRQVFSNWSKYEEPLPSLDESRAVDFESLLHAPQSGGFRFKSEQQWDTGSYGRFGELFTPDAELLVSGLTSLPFYERLGIDKMLFSEDEIGRMESCAKENYVVYEKLNKSKPKPKITATDLFKIDQAEKYSVVDQVNGPIVETGTSTSKPIFSVEEPAEATPVELSLPTHAAGSGAEPSTSGRESTAAVASAPEGDARDFHFGKPPTSSFVAAENTQSQALVRERTPLRDGSRGVTPPEFHFERAPPPSYASSNVRSPFHSRESTPAKEAAPTMAARGSGGSRAPVSRGSSDVWGTGRESTPEPAAPPAREKEMEQKVREDRPTVAGLTSLASVTSENISPREGTPARERSDDSALRENSPLLKVAYDHPRAAPFASQEVEHSLDKISSKVDTPGEEETPKESVLQRNGVDSQEEPLQQRSLYESDVVSEQKSDENGQICAENDNYSKKRGKQDVKKLEGQQRGGGRHGRRKKGQNASAKGGEQLRSEAENICGDTADTGAEGAVHTATKAAAPEEVGREEPRPSEKKKKPERPPPPAVLLQDRQQSPQPVPQPNRQQSPQPVPQPNRRQSPQPVPQPNRRQSPQPVPQPNRQQSPQPVPQPNRQQSPQPVPQLSSAPADVRQTEDKVPQPLASKPEEPKARQVSTPATSPDIKAQPPQIKTTVGAKVEPVQKERKSAGRADDDALNFLMSLRGQKAGGVSEVEAAKSAADAAVSRSAIEEDEMKESQKPKPPPVIATEKKEDLEDWLDSMLDD